MIRRSIVILGVVLAMLALVQFNGPHSTKQAAESAIVGPRITSAETSTWFCAGGPAGIEGATHELLVSNPGGVTTARIIGYSAVEQAGVAKTLELGPASELVMDVLDLGADVTSITVEVDGPGVSVAHRIATPTAIDQSNCETETSETWHFASANTEAGNASRLWLLNPYPSDASVDIRVSNESSVLVPPKLRGIIVPAGSARMVDLGEAQERRVQFAFSVESRGSRLAAELVQSISGSGLRMQPGVSQPASRWVLADGFGGEGVTETLFLFNPSGEDTTVTVSVIPNQVPPELFPEPFVVEIGARRYAQLDLTAQTRIPADQLRWSMVQDLGSNGVVVNQVIALAGGGGDGTAATRPSVAGGLSSSTGSSVQSTEWVVASIDPGPDSQSVVTIANGSPDAIALVTITRVQAGSEEQIVEALEVPPLQSLVVDVSDAVTGSPAGLRVRSEVPVAVSARSTSDTRLDLSMWPALPLVSASGELTDVNGG